MAYGLIGSMKTLPGKRGEVVAILLSSAEVLAALGCRQYTVSLSGDDEVTIWVSEVWGSKSEHDDALKLPETRAAITKAMPMIAGDFTRVETTVVGGLGLDERAS